MGKRRIKWKTYWAFAKLAKRWPRKPERRIIAVIAEQAVEMLKEPLSFYGFPVRVDDTMEPGVIGVAYEEAEATLCGCGHGDYRTCPCEPKHPSKATGQFDHIEPILVRDEDGEYVATGQEAAAERAWLADDWPEDD
jgi:hypothetical protein